MTNGGERLVESRRGKRPRPVNPAAFDRAQSTGFFRKDFAQGFLPKAFYPRLYP